MNRFEFIRASFVSAITIPMVDLNPRKREAVSELKIVPDQMLVYDMASLPEGDDIDRIMYMAKNYGIIVYNSARGGKKPSFIAEQTKDTVLIDLFHK